MRLYSPPSNGALVTVVFLLAWALAMFTNTSFLLAKVPPSLVVKDVDIKGNGIPNAVLSWMMCAV